MKLHKVQIREFKSVWDTGPFEIDKVACLVGKNEAGKTAVLQALYRLNPIVEKDGEFDVTDDYPRAEVEDYRHAVETGARKPAIVVTATFQLDESELAAIAAKLGGAALVTPHFTLSKGYAQNSAGKCARTFDIAINEPGIVKHIVDEYGIAQPLRTDARKQDTLEHLAALLTTSTQKKQQAAAAALSAADKIEDEAERASAREASKGLGESEQEKALRERANELRVYKGGLRQYIWDTFLKAALPKFLYFDEYYQMSGHDNVDALKQRKEADDLQPSDLPLLGLIDLARLDLDQLLSPTRTQELKNSLQGASNHLSRQVLKYWSQNKHLRMEFDVRPGLSGDPPGMQKGTNIWGEVFDSKHLVSTGLGTRSAGFVWFFSFLAWYSSQKKKNEALVLLLDEPGLSLHGKAQEDLLRYFEAEILSNPKHQLLYTTHSPFMVDPRHFDRVRIVQDAGIDADGPLPRELDGTKVFFDVLEAGSDTLFPLQGALGYEIYQTLFIGPNNLVVEGASDLLYIQAVASALQSAGRVGLDPRWTITPVGGANKVPTFIALIGSQGKLNVATLIDFQKSDRQMLENLYKSKLLKKSHLLTFAQFTGSDESDIEDMFDESFYLHLVNEEFASSLGTPISSERLKSGPSRILVRLEEYFSRKPLSGGVRFNHYRPARRLAERGSSGTPIPPDTLDRFEAAFRAANALLD